MGSHLSSYPLKLILKVLIILDSNSLENLSVVSKKISEILKPLCKSYAAHISSENQRIKTSTYLNFINQSRKYASVVDPFILSKYALLKPNQVSIPEDPPITTLMISSVKNLEAYKSVDFSKVHTLILSRKKEDTEFYAEAMVQLKTLFSDNEFHHLKTIILHNLHINVKSSIFDQLKLDYVCINNCFLNHECFSNFCSIKRLDMHYIKFSDRIVLSNVIDTCQIIVSGAYYFINSSAIFIPSIRFDSNPVSLEVRSAPKYKQDKYGSFDVELSREPCLKTLICEINKHGSLVVHDSGCFSELELYHGDDPSKVNVLDQNSIDYTYLRSMLPSSDRCLIQIKSDRSPIESCITN